MSGSLFIDVETARNLELVKDTITHKTANTLYGEPVALAPAQDDRSPQSMPDANGISYAIDYCSPAFQ